MTQQDFAQPEPAEERKFTPDDTQTQAEYGIEYPNGRQVFNTVELNAVATSGKALATEKGQGEAQDTYQRSLGYNGVPESLGLRLKFVKRYVQVSYSEPVYLHTGA